MNLAEYAQQELSRINEDPEFAASLVEVVAKFAEYGHSGGSVPFAISYLNKLLRFEPLSPLTSDPAEWIDRSDINVTPMWQSTRNPRAFSEDGGKTWKLLGERATIRTGPEHYAEGVRLLAEAAERDAQGPEVHGGQRVSDPAVALLTRRARVHFAAAQAAAIAAAFHPDSVSWKGVLA